MTMHPTIEESVVRMGKRDTYNGQLPAPKIDRNS